MSDEDHVLRSPCRLHLVGAHGDSSTAPSQSVDELTTNPRELKMATSMSSSYTDHALAPFSTSQPDKTVESSSRHSRSTEPLETEGKLHSRKSELFTSGQPAGADILSLPLGPDAKTASTSTLPPESTSRLPSLQQKKGWALLDKIPSIMGAFTSKNEKNDGPPRSYPIEYFARENERLRSERNWHKKENRHIHTKLQAQGQENRDLQTKLQAQEQEVASLKEKMKDMEYDRDAAQDRCEDLTRKQQELAFKSLEGGEWIPQDENKVKDELDSLKTSIKAWAKEMATTQLAPWRELDVQDYQKFLKAVEDIVVLSGSRRLPEGLESPRKTGLLLNAMLASDVYRAVFDRPFFSLGNGGRGQVADIHSAILDSGNESGAHKWRSQALRLLLPPLHHDSTEAVVKLRSIIEAKLVQESEACANRFLSSPASLLMTSNVEPTAVSRLKNIYQESAKLAFSIWTRKSCLRIVAKLPSGGLRFDPDDLLTIAHPLVRYDEYEDGLRGREVQVLVHPLVQAFGTDEGEGFKDGRVWVKAEVWFEEPKKGN